jgi:integrase
MERKVSYIDQDNARRSLRPGKGTNKATANQIARHIDVLVASKASGGTVELTTAKWLGDIGEKLHKKLVRAELTEPKAAEVVEPDPEPSITLAAFLDEYVATGITRKGEVASSNTLRNWSVTCQLLLECFDGSNPIDSFGLPDGKAFRKWLERRKIPVTKKSPTGRMKESSIRQRVGNAKAMFEHAVVEELLPQNPIRNQVSSLRASEDGKQNIPVEIIDKVIEAAPTTEWKLLIALWRYCGLRRMEPMELTWNDVLWAEGKLRVRSSKTRHHAGKEMRHVPIRDVESYLSDAFATAAKGQLYLFHRFLSIVEDAGYTPWPNLIKNLRLSCENDWIDAGEAPAHVIAAWIGHSVIVQNNAYAIVSDGHFERFNARKKATPKSGNTGGNTGGNKPIRIDANRDETESLPILTRDGKTLKPNVSTGFQRPKDHFMKKSVGPRVV